MRDRATYLDELRKEINGKQVIYVDPRIKVDALLICPPGGSQISVKPYGYTPEELQSIYRKADWLRSIKELSDPKFCILSYRIDEGDEADELLNWFADISGEGFTLNVKDVEDISRKSQMHSGGSPSCPYG